MPKTSTGCAGKAVLVFRTGVVKHRANPTIGFTSDHYVTLARNVPF